MQVAWGGDALPATAAGRKLLGKDRCARDTVPSTNPRQSSLCGWWCHPGWRKSRRQPLRTEKFDTRKNGGRKIEKPLTSYVVVNGHGPLVTWQVLVLILGCDRNITVISKVKPLRLSCDSSDLLAQEEPARRVLRTLLCPPPPPPPRPPQLPCEAAVERPLPGSHLSATAEMEAPRTAAPPGNIIGSDLNITSTRSKNNLKDPNVDSSTTENSPGHKYLWLWPFFRVLSVLTDNCWWIIRLWRHIWDIWWVLLFLFFVPLLLQEKNQLAVNC